MQLRIVHDVDRGVIFGRPNDLPPQQPQPTLPALPS